jgi:hypothetical protein
MQTVYEEVQNAAAIVIFCDHELVASFFRTPHGLKAYGAFRAMVASHNGSILVDEAGLTLIGELGEMLQQNGARHDQSI